MADKEVFSFLDFNYLKYLPSDKNVNILDAGCGRGEFLQYLKSKGFTNLTGVDIDEESVAYCQCHIAKDVELVNDLSDFLEKHRNEYDLIILKEVIYYFPRERLIPYLKLFLSALKNGGVMLIETFNGSTWTGPFIKYKDYKINHIFTEISLKRVLMDAGFETVEVTGGMIDPSTNIKRRFWLFLRKIWEFIIKGIFILERGFDPENPRIFTKVLIAKAQKD